jgi:hypothetical protein
LCVENLLDIARHPSDTSPKRDDARPTRIGECEAERAATMNPIKPGQERALADIYDEAFASE